MKYRTLKSGDEKRSRLLEIIRKIDIDEDDDLDESELVQERLTKNSISDLSTRFGDSDVGDIVMLVTS